MATVISNVSPIHGTCVIGQPYGNPRVIQMWFSYGDRFIVDLDVLEESAIDKQVWISKGSLD